MATGAAGDAQRLLHHDRHLPVSRNKYVLAQLDARRGTTLGVSGKANSSAVVFWAILFTGFDSPFSAYSNISEHALNSAYALVEIILTRTEPRPWIHIVPIIILLALYLGLAYLTYATQHFYVYSFLDNHKNSPGVVAGYIMGILIGSIIIFVIVRYVILLRMWVTETKLGKTGVFSPKDAVNEMGGARAAAAKEDIQMTALEHGQRDHDDVV